MGSAAKSSRAYKNDSYVKAFERNAMISEIRQDEVIRMAKIAKLPTYFRTGELVNLKELEDFALRASRSARCAFSNASSFSRILRSRFLALLTSSGVKPSCVSV